MLNLDINKNFLIVLYAFITPALCTWILLFCLLAALSGRQDNVWCVKLQAGASQNPWLCRFYFSHGAQSWDQVCRCCVVAVVIITSDLSSLVICYGSLHFVAKRFNNLFLLFILFSSSPSSSFPRCCYNCYFNLLCVVPACGWL